MSGVAPPYNKFFKGCLVGMVFSIPVWALVYWIVR